MGEEGVNGCSVDSPRKPVIPAAIHSPSNALPYLSSFASTSIFVGSCAPCVSSDDRRFNLPSPPVTRLNRSRNCRDFASYTRYSRHDSPSPNGRRKIGIIITLQFFPLLTGVTGVTPQFKSHGYMYRLKKGYPTIKIIRSGRNRGQEGREKIWRGDVLF